MSAACFTTDDPEMVVIAVAPVRQIFLSERYWVVTIAAGSQVVPGVKVTCERSDKCGQLQVSSGCTADQGKSLRVMPCMNPPVSPGPVCISHRFLVALLRVIYRLFSVQ